MKNNVDEDPDNFYQHQNRYPYWKAVDSFVAGFIYDEILKLIKEERTKKREELTDVGFELIKKMFGDD